MDAQASRRRSPPGSLRPSSRCCCWPPAIEARPGRCAAAARSQVVTVEASSSRTTSSCRGEIQAREERRARRSASAAASLERPVNVGDRVAAGQVVARLDPQTEQNALSAAKAALEAAAARSSTARNAFERQEQLMAQGFTTRPRFDQALQAQETGASAARGCRGAGRAGAGPPWLHRAQRRRRRRRDGPQRRARRSRAAGPGHRADWPATMAATPSSTCPRRSSNPGRRTPPIRVALADDPPSSPSARCARSPPQADPVTRTFQVRVGLQDPPDAMRLGIDRDRHDGAQLVRRSSPFRPAR